MPLPCALRTLESFDYGQNSPATAGDTEWINKEIDQALTDGRIRLALPGEARGISPIRVETQGPDQKRRLIHQLHLFNRMLEPPPKFTLEALPFVAQMLRPADWLTSFDIAKFYPHIRLSPELSVWLGFRWSGKIYLWTVLPFGLSWAPYWATKLMRPILAHVRSQWHLRVALYFDDGLLADQSPTRLRALTNDFVALLHRLGFSINAEKSVLEPTQSIKFLGFQLNSTGAPTCSLLPHRRLSLLADAKRLARSAGKPVPALRLARFLGSLASTISAFTPARALSAALNADLRQAAWSNRRSLERASVQLSSRAALEARAIVRALDAQLWRDRPLLPRQDAPEGVLTTDASGWGWSAYISAPSSPEAPLLQAQDQWQRVTITPRRHLVPSFEEVAQLCAAPTPTAEHSPIDLPLPTPPLGRVSLPLFSAELHSSVAELLAVLYACLAFRQQLRNKRLLLRCDNTQALAAVIKQSSPSPVLNHLALLLATATRFANIQIVMAAHLPGSANQLADLGSRRWFRHREHLEWPLSPIIFGGLLRRWPLADSEMMIDAFASSSNAQLPRYWSLEVDARALAQDALAQDWTCRHLFLNPPFGLMRRVVAKLVMERPAIAIVISPDWPAAAWFQVLASLATESLLLPAWAVEAGPGRQIAEPLRNPAWRLRAWMLQSGSC